MRQSEYTTVMFDLDGTVTDSAPGITAAVAYALRQYGIEVADRSALHAFIGPPLRDSFIKYYGFTPAQADEAVTQHYRSYYGTRGIYECRVYDGVAELLQRLHDEGAQVLLATSKPEVYARRVVEHCALQHCIDRVCGSNLDGTREDKAEVVAYALRCAGVTDPKHALMVGDRSFDVLGARKNGVDTVGVLYGFGTMEELAAAGARYLAATPEDVYRFWRGTLI